MIMDLWGIFDLGRQDFASRSIGHAGEYIGVILHHPSKSEVVAWLDSPSMMHGNRVEVRAIGPEYANRMTDCICPVHRVRKEPEKMKSKLEGMLNEAVKPLPVAVGALLFRANGDVLAASRKTDHEDLGLPGGKVEPGETEHQALVRELLEETGLRAVRYHRIFGMPDPGGYWFVTFLVVEWTGEIESREGAKVCWVPPARMLQASCQFRDYNRDLFAHLEVLPALRR